MIAPWRPAALLALLLGACTVDPAANPGPRCSVERDCAADRTCYQGFCIIKDVVPGGECTLEGVRRPCYTGPVGTATHAPCRAGEQECAAGRWSSCLAQVLPASGEIACNGIDDDCNGFTDDISGASCNSGQQGVCEAGTFACRGGIVDCLPLTLPALEVCNGEDDDCDGVEDQGVSSACYDAADGGCRLDQGAYLCSGVCRPGTAACSAGMPGPCQGAVYATPGPDGCTPPGQVAVDDDCDDLVDEDCTCNAGETISCYGGPPGTAGVGICRTGTATCDAAQMRFGACMGEGRPRPESCGNDGADDDCDGTRDNVPLRGTICIDTATVGVCREGVRQCEGGALRCITARARPELCNGLDDNCNGDSDEGFNFLTDNANCGECGRACGAGLTCCGGRCVNTSTHAGFCGNCATQCGAGLSCCAGACTDTRTNQNHCGRCGGGCGPNRQCCNSVCRDTRSDEAACGNCTTTCGAGQECCNSSCQTSCAPCNPSCTGGQTCCSGSCTDADEDEANCGMCNRSCGNNRLCCGGDCVPNDEMNCGQCGRQCTGNTPLCCQGVCVANDEANCIECGESCGVNEACCAGGCTDITTDQNCGMCGRECTDPQPDCSAGFCCQGGYTRCGNSCVNLEDDRNNCGRCGNECGILGLIPLNCRNGSCGL